MVVMVSGGHEAMEFFSFQWGSLNKHIGMHALFFYNDYKGQAFLVICRPENGVSV